MSKYHVFNLRTGELAGVYENRKTALRRADTLDADYGACNSAVYLCESATEAYIWIALLRTRHAVALA